MDFSISFEKIDKKRNQHIVITHQDILLDVEELAYISFTLDDSFYYQVELYRKSNKWTPNKIFHSYPISCPYCTMRSSECSFLTVFSENIVKTMMNIPHSRLKILTTLGIITFHS